MAELFGTDGIRGVAGTELTAELCFNIGRAAASVLRPDTAGKPRVLIGKDTRISGDMIQAALTAGLCASGAVVRPAGVVPTPALAWMVREYQADAAVMISASHNPMEYNGIKIFNKNGYKLDDCLEERIEAVVRGAVHTGNLPGGAGIGTVEPVYTAVEDYISYALTTADTRLDGIRAAVDCANGASSLTAPQTLRKLGASVQVIHHTPDGLNINAGCGSTHMKDIQRLTVESGADIGLAFDGDADRLLAVDEEGAVVDGDQIMAVCGNYMLSRGKLKNNTIVATVMSNSGFFRMAEKNGIRTPETRVGDRYVLEKMLEEGANLGGEQSGHIIFLDLNTTGDGLITALQLLSVMKHTGKRLSELRKVMTVMPQVMINVPVQNQCKYDYIGDAEIMSAVHEAERSFESGGRVLVRPSGTEALIRVMIEGGDTAQMKKQAEKIAAVIKKNLKQ